MGVWKSHGALEERGCGGVPQLYPRQPSDLPRLDGANQADTSQGRHMVLKLAGGWTEGGHNTPAPRHGGQLQVFDVSILCSTQHILHLVRDVCQAFWDEYGDEVVSNPTTVEGWKEIAASYSSRWNFHHVLGALNGKHIRIRCPVNSSTAIKGTIQLCSLRLLRQTTGLRGSKLEPQEQHLMPSCGMS